MHSRKYYLLAGIIAFAVLISLIIIYAIVPGGKPGAHGYIELEIISGLIKDGDIICRLGDRLWSRYFRDVSVTDKRFSHMGILRMKDDVITVIHAEGNTGHGIDSVNEIALDEFIEFAGAIGIYRIKDLDGSQISKLAVNYLGVPFDWQFDLNDDSKLYCTELLFAILKEAAPEIELNHIFIRHLGKTIIPLDAISNSELFNEIYFIARN